MTVGLAGAGGDGPRGSQSQAPPCNGPFSTGHNGEEPAESSKTSPHPAPATPQLLGPCRPAQIVRVINAVFPEIPSGFLIALGWGWDALIVNWYLSYASAYVKCSIHGEGEAGRGMC